MCRIISLFILALISGPAFAQQIDPTKFGSVLRQQRDVANDNVAACSVAVSDLQAKIAELEKQLAEAKKPPASE